MGLNSEFDIFELFVDVALVCCVADSTKPKDTVVPFRLRDQAHRFMSRGFEVNRLLELGIFTTIYPCTKYIYTYIDLPKYIPYILNRYPYGR